MLLEKGPVGDGSSSRAAGIITGLLWSDTGVRVRKRCLELLGELSRELIGVPVPATGCLNLFRPKVGLSVRNCFRFTIGSRRLTRS